MLTAEHWGKEFLSITNMNLLIRFNKAREIFPSAARVLSIFLSILATSAKSRKGEF